MDSQPTETVDEQQTDSDDLQTNEAIEQTDSEATEEQLEADDASKISTKEPEFAELSESPPSKQIGSINRFLDVSVQVAAELGKVTLPIGELLKIGEGSVIELNRSISEPIDLVAQGVKIASGDVVVIDDCFAIRIKEVESESGS